ncbi:LacI family DNA-binding transcriptional regulator [Pelagibius litoralis]|uniref:LacI family DNA-binding transcriptional regulator n=1 Tax=Pelagibius litoralis TaxID=374515 RepID=A0A967EYV9_9PROT|nr:LacI family DNA-binding transcriptional regulator [Pelagibius litoralis]NIA69967.1 LacI family DNA-binding transcriptional regulator [Pelagibius litoralis]
MPKTETKNRPGKRISSGSGTLNEVAKAAGVSEMTVSRVLRGKTNVSQKTRDKVQAAVKALGYVPNRLAGALASAKSMQLAVIIPSLRNIVFPEVLAGITDCLDTAGYHAVIGVSEYDLGREAELIAAMMSWRPAGIIIANAQHHRDAVTILRASPAPVVEVMELTRKPIDMCVGLDHRKAAVMTAERLLKKGYRRFAYLGCDLQRDKAAGKRFKGFSDTVLKGGGKMVAELTVDEPSGIGLGRRHMASLLAQSAKIEIVYASNDAVASGALMYCLAEGISVPRELALASFSGLEVGQSMPLPLTTIRSPRYEMGRLSAERILDRLNGKTPPRITDAGFEFIEGETT